MSDETALEPTDGQFKTPDMRASPSLVERRTEYVTELRLKNVKHKKILDHIMEEFDIAIRQANTYITKADKSIIESVELDRDAMVARNLKRRELMFREAMQEDKLNNAIKLLNQESRILGMYNDSIHIEKNENDGVEFIIPDNGRDDNVGEDE